MYHVIKARIKTQDSTFITYAVVTGELYYHSDSLLRAYKASPKLFTQTVNNVMINTDTMHLYSQIFRVRHDEKDVVLLAADTHSKLLRSQIKEITLLQYIPADYTYKMIYSDVMSSDAEWLAWRVTQTEHFYDTNGMCYYDVWLFNKPDDNTKNLLKRARAFFLRMNHETIPIEEIARMRQLLRKARIVVFGMCTC